MAEPLRILPSVVEVDDRGDLTMGHFLDRIARALERIADRLDHDAETFDEMVEKGKGLST